MGTEASRVRKRRHYAAHKDDAAWMQKRNDERTARRDADPSLRENDRVSMAARRAVDPAATAVATTRSSWLYRLRKYGITEAQYYELVELQGRRCALCPATRPWPTRELDKWLIDHDHVTGKVRGLLCDNCNKALGQFHDDVEVLRNAIEYLQHPPIERLNHG